MKTAKDDGMQHDYETCPRCDRIASTEDIVRLDGKTMCRRCLRERMDQSGRQSRR